ncbi:MAG: hypothetical protein KY394_04305 [Actinobacteria bacterium]|nr:hypothetical protein [Actinomycetota bacterium]
MVEKVLIGLVVLGFASFLAGYVWNGVTAHKRRLGHQEAAGVGREGRWRFRGRAMGLSWSDQIEFGELKRGVRDGSWRHSVRLQQFLLVTVGGVLSILALTLLIGWLTRPVGLLVAVGLVLYVLVQLGRGFGRA